MNLLLEYIGQNYITLMLLAGLTTILFANRHTKIEGVKYVWAVIGVVLAITICEYLEYWCVKYNKPVFLLYIKAAFCYNMYPLLILLELHLIAPIKKMILLLLPYMVNMLFVICDLFEYCNIITDHTTNIVALDMLIYYFYLSAIHYIKLQEKLHSSRLKLEKQKNELLMAQIQPHFINNSLMAIQAQCIDHPDIYESIKNFSRYLHSNFDNIGSTHSVTFKQ